MSLFRIFKYSSLLYLLGRHRDKLFRSVAVLLFALLTTLLYDDVRHYLETQHPDTLLYALIGKIFIVYGSLAFVLWQFRPRQKSAQPAAAEAGPDAGGSAGPPADRLQALADIDAHDRLHTRYQRILERHPKSAAPAAREDSAPPTDPPTA